MYLLEFKQDLEKDLRNDTGGHFQRILTGLSTVGLFIIFLISILRCVPAHPTPMALSPSTQEIPTMSIPFSICVYHNV